jgi:hypothetical protein
MPRFESELQFTSVKNASTSNGGMRFSNSGNTIILHMGDDARVGIGLDTPETKLHVDGAITATGLVLPPGILSSQSDSAAAFGFNPNFTEWNESVANGYSQTGAGQATQSSESNLGGSSARFNNTGLQRVGALTKRATSRQQD